MTAPVVLGIDPGKHGAIAWATGTGRLEVHDMPDATGAALGALLADLILENRPMVAYVERVGSMPGQGHMNVWTFAEGYGVILGVLGALQVPVVHVTPGVWKKAAGLIKRKGETSAQAKTRSRQLAIETWPRCSHLFARAKDDGRAEAALIARYGRAAAGA